MGSIIGKAFMFNHLWRLQCTLEVSHLQVLHVTTKRMHGFYHTFMLWHKRLGHSSKDMIAQLYKSNLIPNINFKNAQECVNCLKGKMTNIRKLDAKRSQSLLEIIHTDVCGPFPNKTICENSYFVSLIDDFSRYSHLFLISEKSSVLNCFKIF